jgi:hypothetical protein
MAASKRKSDQFDAPDYDDCTEQTQRQGHIPRPPNAWILYRQAKSKEIREELMNAPGGRPLPQSLASKDIAERWKNEAPEVRAQFEHLAELEKRRHAQMYPNYRFQPQSKEQKEKQRQQEKEAKAREKEARQAAKKRRGNKTATSQYHSVAYPATAGASTSAVQLPPMAQPYVFPYPHASAPAPLAAGANLAVPVLRRPEDHFGPFGSTPPLQALELFDTPSPMPSLTPDSGRQSLPPLETRHPSAEPSQVADLSRPSAEPTPEQVQAIVDALQPSAPSGDPSDHWTLAPPDQVRTSVLSGLILSLTTVGQSYVTFQLPHPSAQGISAWMQGPADTVFSSADAAMFSTDALGVLQVENIPEDLIADPTGSLDFAQGQLLPMDFQGLLGNFDFNGFDSTFGGVPPLLCPPAAPQDMLSEFMNFEGLGVDAFTPSSSSESTTSPEATLVGTPAGMLCEAEPARHGYAPPSGAAHANVRRVAGSWPASFAVNDDDDDIELGAPASTPAPQFGIQT